MTVKFMWNGIKVDGNLYKAGYNIGPWTRESGLPDGTITVYIDGYKRLPQIPGLDVYNDSDIMRDYFESDTIRIRPGNPYYDDAKAAFDKRQVHDKAMHEKYMAKRIARKTA